ncbi:TPA: hypothetical protein DD449_00150 [Candidatus Berkelbacteria bacterium]|nr:hypothetical protein [Candidatus Berkelbacteria bacterium]
MRIANILANAQVNPSNILALTFTNSGAYAMRKRLLEIVGPSSYAISIHTFHSFCNEIINTFPEKFLTARRLNQLTDLEQILYIQSILDKNNFKTIKPLKSPYLYQKAILDSINKLKQENIDPKKFEEKIEQELIDFKTIDDLYHDKGAYKGEMKGKYKDELSSLERNKELAKVYKDYQKILSDEGKYDYADMILFVLGAFKKEKDILSYYQEKYQYILVDEFQDTNTAQNEIVRSLGSFYESPNIFAVGDDEQSVFRFQGASLENILFFSKTYPEAKVIILEDNYRSTQDILDLSRALISNNQNQIAGHLKVSKKLKSNLTSKGKIYLAEFKNVATENFFIASEIKDLIEKGTDPNEIAVLYKQHSDVEDLTENLARLKVPYKLEVGGNILDDPEIQKIINYLKILDIKKPNDLLFFEVLSYDFFNIPPIEIYKLSRKASKERESIVDTILSENKLSEPIKKFFSTLLDLQHFAQNNTFASTFEYLINNTGYLDYLLKKEDTVHHLNRLQIFYEEIKKLNVRQKDLNIAGFLKYLDSLTENELKIKDREVEADFAGVNLMTAHKSKGLEFENVFIFKLIDKHWGNKTKRELIKLPGNILSIQQNNDLSSEALAELEEERRLFYVALTRAKKNIYLSFADDYGDQESSKFAVPSQFLTELPNEKILKLETAKYEKESVKRLALAFQNDKWHPGKALKEFIKQIVEDFSLSATSLNSYINCPKQFFLDHIIRVPKAKDFSQSYGTAVHKAMENLFLIQIRDGKLATKSDFVKFYVNALDEEILTPAEIQRAKNDGTEILEKYYDFYKEEMIKKGPPISCEYNFSSHNVHFDNIPITGKIDKIEMINSIGNTVRIIDYKTSQPKTVNDLLGQTKTSDKSYLYQAFFYKLLAEYDTSFKWKIAEIEFDFIQPEKGRFKKIKIPIEEEEYKKFKELVSKSYSEIKKLNFDTNKKSCKAKRECDYINICN